MLDHRGPAVGGEGALRALQLPFDEVGADDRWHHPEVTAESSFVERRRLLEDHCTINIRL